MSEEKIKKEDKEIFFQQYKLAAEMADNATARREGANKIFLTANSIVFAFIATQAIFSGVHVVVSFFGILLSFIWLVMLENHRNLCYIKYHVICEMEEFLPWPVYREQWKRLKASKHKIFRSRSMVEKKIPLLFLLFYLFLFIFSFINIS
jgi:hypothetical protein